MNEEYEYRTQVLQRELICDEGNLRREVAEMLKRPSTIYRPRIYTDGNKWCALYGDNIQDGVAVFGDSPEEAFADFDAAWVKKL